ncbi:hypothetical protein DINO107042_05650 [Dichelobacter nodosus]|uniref:hypothetical protein n=2 Tax=Dichelobacter nodosus TaxID=870 RepID=UPI00128BAFC0|nr:hypothetical protein [Dichelobacter nodosus]
MSAIQTTNTEQKMATFFTKNNRLLTNIFLCVFLFLNIFACTRSAIYAALYEVNSAPRPTYQQLADYCADGEEAACRALFARRGDK